VLNKPYWEFSITQSMFSLFIFVILILFDPEYALLVDSWWFQKYTLLLIWTYVAGLMFVELVEQHFKVFWAVKVIIKEVFDFYVLDE